MKIFITHCSANKDLNLKDSGEMVTPDTLYIATPTQRFMKRCKQEKVKWAIFSDKYGVWFPEEKHPWYEKCPNKVTESEYRLLLNNFTRKLQHFNEVWFYHNPGRFHPLYKRIINETPIKDQIILFSHLNEIIGENRNE